jgi:hypothetical protein
MNVRLTGYALSVALAVLGVSVAAEGRTPREPPTPPSCLAACRAGSPDCLERCVSSFSAKPWRERLTLELPRARACLEQERACKGQRCLSALRACVWKVAGLAAARMERCWAARQQSTGRCRRHEGKSAWSCRNQADVTLFGCRKAALTRRLDENALRVLMAIDDELAAELLDR